MKIIVIKPRRNGRRTAEHAARNLAQALGAEYGGTL